MQQEKNANQKLFKDTSDSSRSRVIETGVIKIWFQITDTQMSLPPAKKEKTQNFTKGL